LSGSSSGSGVEIGAGPYMVSENSSINSDIVAELDQELSTTASTTFSPSYSGDCSGQTGALTATGTISTGQLQACNITNTIIVTGGTVPSTN